LLIAQKPDIILEFMFKYYSKYDLMKTEMFQKLRNLFKGSDNPANETATQEVSRIEKYFEDMSVKIGESYAEILEKVRKSPIQFKQLENAGPLPTSTDSILDQIVIRDNLTLENMFDDARLIVLGQLSQANSLITYYNAAIEKLQADHQSAVSSLQQNHEAAISTMQQEHQTSLSSIQHHAIDLESKSPTSRTSSKPNQPWSTASIPSSRSTTPKNPSVNASFPNAQRTKGKFKRSRLNPVIQLSSYPVIQSSCILHLASINKPPNPHQYDKHLRPLDLPAFSNRTFVSSSPLHSLWERTSAGYYRPYRHQGYRETQHDFSS